MTTAHDLPDPAAPAPGRLARWVPRRLAAVPDVLDSPDAGPFVFDDALGKAAPRLRRYATRRLGDEHEAEEVVQEALLRACQHEAGFATEDDLMAWSTVVTGRLVIDRLRVRTRSVSVPEVPDSARCGRDTADVVVARDEARAALEALEAMPTRQAGVLWAREVEGLSYDAIADRFGLSEPTVRSLLHRARRSLRREYAARGGTLPVAGIVLAIAPWRGSLHGLSRLREVAKQSLAPASASAAALTVLGATAIFVGPIHPGAPGAIPALDSPSATPASKTAPAKVAIKQRAVRHASSKTVRPTDVAPISKAASHPRHHHLRQVTVPRICANGRTGVNCRPPSAQQVLWIGRELPANPFGFKKAGISSDRVDCQRLPTTPVSRCATQDDDDQPIDSTNPAPGRS